MKGESGERSNFSGCVVIFFSFAFEGIKGKINKKRIVWYERGGFVGIENEVGGSSLSGEITVVD